MIPDFVRYKQPIFPLVSFTLPEISVWLIFPISAVTNFLAMDRVWILPTFFASGFFLSGSSFFCAGSTRPLPGPLSSSVSDPFLILPLVPDLSLRFRILPLPCRIYSSASGFPFPLLCRISPSASGSLFRAGSSSSSSSLHFWVRSSPRPYVPFIHTWPPLLLLTLCSVPPGAPSKCNNKGVGGGFREEGRGLLCPSASSPYILSPRVQGSSSSKFVLVLLLMPSVSLTSSRPRRVPLNFLECPPTIMLLMAKFVVVE